MAELSGEPATFAKVLKSREVIALGFGAMIGWSWVLMTGVWLTNAGTLSTLIAFAVGGFAVALIGLTYSELASAMPKAGGERLYTARTRPSLVFRLYMGAAVFLCQRVFV